jgi:hypothetical protein
MVTWKFLFIGATVLLVYFTYGVASHGGPAAFFVGAAAGGIATYLFTRARAEAAANNNTNTQNVNLSLNQHKVGIGGGEGFSEAQLYAIAEIVDTLTEKKQLVNQTNIPPLTAPEPPTLPNRRFTWSDYVRRNNDNA